MQKICLIQTAVASPGEAKAMATGLMDVGMAGCVQISAAGFSTYRWKGRLERAEEYYISIKTTSACREPVIGWLQQHHPYELPEIIWSEVDATEDYANWIHHSVIYTEPA